MKEHKYILDKKGNPKACKDVLKWGKWFESSDRQVKNTFIGKYRVSTVFLGLDYSFLGKGKPILWETMVFQKMTKREGDKRNKELTEMYLSIKKRGLPHDKTLVRNVPKSTIGGFYKEGMQTEAPFPMDRYTSRIAAVRGHNKMVKLVTKTIKN